MFEREGVAGPADVAIIGSRQEVEDRIAEIKEAGATDFCPTIFALSPDDKLETESLLASLCG